MTMTAAEEKIDSIVEKIAKLAAQAESASADEAIAYQERVNALMAKYAIDQARIDAKKASGQKEPMTEKNVELAGSWLAPWSEMLQGICGAADIRLVVSTRGQKKTYHLLGFESDVDQAVMLNASLQLQSTLALREFAATDYAPSYATAAQKYKIRRDFMFGFEEAAVARVRRARREALDAAKQQDAEIAARLSDGGDGESQATVGTELVLATKRERVDEFVAEKYPRLGRARGGNVQRGYGSANASGRVAGERANVNGRTAIGGSRTAIK